MYVGQRASATGRVTDVTGTERSDLAHLEARLFGIDGSGEGGALGGIESRIAGLEKRLDRWDGAITMIRIAAGTLGLGGIALLLRLLVAS